MSWTQNTSPHRCRGPYYPALPPEALAGVRTRRVIALCFDAIFIGILAVADLDCARSRDVRRRVVHPAAAPADHRLLL